MTAGYEIREISDGELTADNCTFTADMRVAKVFNRDTRKPFIMMALGQAPYTCWTFDNWNDIDLLRNELRRLGIEAFGPQPN